MSTQHPITPPPELVQEWYDQAKQNPCDPINWFAVRAAAWGSDQELEACLANIHTMYGKDKADWLRAVRRPKPPSLKEQALNDLDNIQTHDQEGRQIIDLSNIRRALEALND